MTALAEPTPKACKAALAMARAAAALLPAGSMARRFAESDLVQAGSEAGNGEFDDCIELADKARAELARHPAAPPGVAPSPPVRQDPR